MKMQLLKEKQGHWQDMVSLSPFKKAYRRDMDRDLWYLIDEDGNGLYFMYDGDIGKPARHEDLFGYKDWKPVI